MNLINNTIVVDEMQMVRCRKPKGRWNLLILWRHSSNEIKISNFLSYWTV